MSEKEIELKGNINLLQEELRKEIERRILNGITHPDSKIIGYEKVCVQYVEKVGTRQLFYEGELLRIEILHHQNILIRGTHIAIISL